MTVQSSSSTELRNRKLQNTLTWFGQALLAALFLFAGSMKFVMPAEQMTANSSLPLWFFRFIGVAEICGAVGLILPALLRIRPILTPVAAGCLFVIMLGAIVTSASLGATVMAVPFAAAVVAALVGYSRLRLIART